MFTLDQVVPWGRSLDEYRRMFKLSDTDLDGLILGCGDGPASFNAEATSAGHRVVSCDPLYRFDVGSIESRIEETSAQVLEQARRNMHEFVWHEIASVEALGALRNRAMRTFLDDYETGRAAGRYVDAELPHLPFADRSFDLGVCSHLLFLYSDQLDAAFHVAAAAALCRVATEVRIFPLVALGGVPSPHVAPVLAWARDRGLNAALEDVPYEFQRGATQMMRIQLA